MIPQLFFLSGLHRCAMLNCSVVSTLCSSTRLHCAWGFSRQEYWNGSSCPSPGDLPNPGIKPWSPTLKEDALPAESLRSPWILEWVAYPFSRASFWLRSRTEVPRIVGEFFTSWATRETPGTPLWTLISPYILRYFYCVVICDQTLSVDIHGIKRSSREDFVCFTMYQAYRQPRNVLK